MELHNGTIELRSTAGAGTAATITFPPERAVVQPAMQESLPAA